METHPQCNVGDDDEDGSDFGPGGDIAEATSDGTEGPEREVEGTEEADSSAASSTSSPVKPTADRSGVVEMSHAAVPPRTARPAAVEQEGTSQQRQTGSPAQPRGQHFFGFDGQQQARTSASAGHANGASDGAVSGAQAKDSNDQFAAAPMREQKQSGRAISSFEEDALLAGEPA